MTLSAQLALTQADATGLPLLYMYNRYPRQIKPSFWFGLMLYCASLFGASFARRTWLLVIFQGVLPGVLAVQNNNAVLISDRPCCMPQLVPLHTMAPRVSGCVTCSTAIDSSLTHNLRWFDKRKGTAAGIIFAGGGVGGAVSRDQDILKYDDPLIRSLLSLCQSSINMPSTTWARLGCSVSPH